MPEVFVQLNGISHAYREGDRHHPVLRDITLSIERGKTVALLGRSGSGKSTLLNLISGIDRPDAGSVIIDGNDLTAFSERRRTLFRRRHMGFIYQFFNLVPTLTAFENIALVLELNDLDPDMVREKAHDMLNAVGLDGMADRFPDQLSGGEQQRVALARAIVHAPGLVLADEPTGNLDAGTGRRVLGLLRDLLDRRGGTLIMVTHSTEIAGDADRVLTLEDGMLEEPAR